MKQVTALKLTCVGAFVATLGVGCASSGYARYDADSTDMDQGVGVSASADVGTDNKIRTEADVRNENAIRTDLRKDDSTTVVVDTDRDNTVIVDTDRDDVVVNADPEIYVDRDRRIVDMDAEGEDRITVSALSFVPETRATWVNKFPFYDRHWNIRAIEVHTFAVPSNVDVDVNRDTPEFRADLPAGSVFVEAAGGAGDVRTGRVIQHSPSPTR
jgi:hypothetical protein